MKDMIRAFQKARASMEPLALADHLQPGPDDMEPESAMDRLTDRSFPGVVSLIILAPLWAPCVIVSYAAGYWARWCVDAWKAGWSL